MKTTLLVLWITCAAIGCSPRHPTVSPDPPRNDSINDPAAPPRKLAIFEFTQQANLRPWQVRNEAAPGGRAHGKFIINEAGNAVFSGEVSSANGSGSSAVQYFFNPIDVSKYRALVLGLKGDGKTYQLRVESGKADRQPYACDFQTSGIWQTVEIPFSRLHALLSGKSSDPARYPGQTMDRIQLRFATDTTESFQLELDRIWLQE